MHIVLLKYPHVQIAFLKFTSNPEPVLENDTHKLLWDFDIHTNHLISARRPDILIINKKKRICKIDDFAVPADHRIKLRECEKKDKCLDLARELKTPWSTKVTIVPIVIGAFGTVTKGLLKGLEDLDVGGRVEIKEKVLGAVVSRDILLRHERVYQLITWENTRL